MTQNMRPLDCTAGAQDVSQHAERRVNASIL